MIITTTHSIDDCKIDAYMGIVTGTDIYLVGGVLGGGLMNQENLYSTAFENAKRKMEQKAAALGADAIIGVSTNVTSTGGTNNIIVIVSGTAVTLREVMTVNGVEYTSEIPDL